MNLASSHKSHNDGPPPQSDPGVDKRRVTSSRAGLATCRQVELATPRARLGARIIDMTIYGVLYAVIIAIVVVSNNIADNIINIKAVHLLFLAFPIMMLAVVHEVILVAVCGQTLGKMAKNIRIVRTDNGNTPGCSKAIVRWLVPVLLAFPCVLGFLTMLAYLAILQDSRHQGWHDKAAATIVVKAYTNMFYPLRVGT